MILELPVTSDPAQEFVTQLDTQKFSFEFKYNDVGLVWTMDILDPVTNSPILLGVPVVLGTDFLQPYNFNMGGMGVFDTSSVAGQDAGSEDLGERLKVYWYTLDELT